MTAIHLCAKDSNIKSFKFLIKNEETLLKKDSQNNNILHIATKSNNYDLIETVLDFRFLKRRFISEKVREILVFEKNNDGQSCFLTAASIGNRTIMNYLLNNFDKDRLLNEVDNKLNTALHLACLNKHENIVRSLLKFNINFNEKNLDYLSIFDICCLNGSFELVKLILEKNPIKFALNINREHDNIDQPIKLACQSGNIQLLQYLIDQGACLTFKNDNQMSLLDIAFKKNDKEIIKTLIKNDSEQMLFKKYTKIEKERIKILCNEMPDAMALILDKSVSTNLDGTNQYNFDNSILDISFKFIESAENHPLFLIAQTNNRLLLTHKSVKELLRFKWSVYPFWIYYFNLIVYLCYLLPFTYLIFSTTNLKNNYQEQNFIMNNESTSNYTVTVTQSISYSQILMQAIALMIVGILLSKEIFQSMFVFHIRYFYELDNWIEMFTYICSAIFLLPIPSTNSSFYKTNYQRSLAPLVALSSWIVLALFIQKVPRIGIFGGMFKKMLHKSLYFSPILLVFLIGFSISFTIQDQEITEITLNSTSTIFIDTLSMIVGELGIERDKLSIPDSYTRKFVFFFYISIMCIMILNLMIGIAVGEIKEVVDDADMRSIAMKIKFSLRTQLLLFKLNDSYERPMLYVNKPIEPKNKNNDKIDDYKNKFCEKFKIRKEIKKMNKENETNELIINQLNSIQTNFEDFKTAIENKLNSLNFEISELRLDTNMIKVELMNRNSY